MEQDFIKTLKGKKTINAPVWLMRQAGRYLPEYREVRSQAGGFLDLCYNPKLASEVTLQPLRRFDLDAAIIFSDILVIPQAMGQKLWFETGEGPKLDPIEKIQDLNDENPDELLKFLSPVFEAVEQTRSSLPDDKSLIGFAGAPWTLACYMINGGGSRDYQNVRTFAMKNPDMFEKIMDYLVRSISCYLIQKIKSGVDVIQIFDSWSGVLSADEFYRYSILPTKKIVENVKAKYPDVPIIGFPRGAGFNYQTYIDETGIDCVSCDQSIPLDQVKQFQKSICVQGNLDNLLLLNGGQAMIDQTRKICDALGDKPFVFNLGHGVIKETDPDNVGLLIKTIKDFKKG
jgi:uroporphyrinogen decarboxylase